MEKIKLENAIRLRDSYKKEIENLKLNLDAVTYLYELVCKDIVENCPEDTENTVGNE